MLTKEEVETTNQMQFNHCRKLLANCSINGADICLVSRAADCQIHFINNLQSSKPSSVKPKLLSSFALNVNLISRPGFKFCFF